jgi:hypothetical protein
MVAIRIPNGNKHCFVNHDFGLPKTNESRLNSIEVWERNWAKAPCRDCQATSVTNNHKNIILDRSGKTKLGQRVRTGDDQTFYPFQNLWHAVRVVGQMVHPASDGCHVVQRAYRYSASEIARAQSAT